MRSFAITALSLLLLLAPFRLLADETNYMHPAFPVLDADSQPVLQSGQPVSSEKTCGSCHDADYIEHRNSHFNGKIQAGCIECHFEDSRIVADETTLDENGLLKRDAIRISSPRNENCAHCHGLVHDGISLLSLPENYESRADRYDLTHQTGVIIAPQNVSDSLLNIKNKDALTHPWDVHSARMVGCTACHYSPNNPAKVGGRRGDLDFLLSDPRRLSTAEYLKHPDHRLAAAVCTDCHDPLATHAFLPYRERHFEVLSCASCHVSAVKGPALKSLDASVVGADGLPLAEYRGVDESAESSLNAAFIKGYAPFLFTSTRSDGSKKIAPYNVVTETYWVAGADDERVLQETVKQAYMEGVQYRPEILKAFDTNGDAQLNAAELRLDTQAKIAVVEAAFGNMGVKEPRIKSEVIPHEIHHGIMPGQWARKDCTRCHASESTLNRDVSLASFVPNGVNPEIPQGGVLAANGSLSRDASGALLLKKDSGSTPYYVFGHTRASWSDLLGLLLLAGVVAGVTIHGGYRIYTRRERNPDHGESERVYLYSAYERIWHWVMAFSVVVLLVTGLQIHFAGNGRSLTLQVAVSIHNFFAVALTVNAFLSLFYHLASNAIRQFIPPRGALKHEVTAQTLYYLKGIFAGNPHPIKESPERKLNVLQQITYLLLLNVLLPVQVVTGVMIWGVSRWPELAAHSGGLFIIAPLHNLGSWLFLSFFVLHFYLTTTGRTVTSNILGMINGYKDIEKPESSAIHGGRNG